MQGHLPALDWIKNQKSDLVGTLIKWSNINSGSFHIAGVRRQAEAIQILFNNLGAELEIFEVEPLRTLSDQAQILNFPIGPLLKYTKRPEAKKQILLTGHLDTVFPEDSFFQTAHLEGDKLFGPGVVDMKGGILVMYAALMALEKSPYADQIGWEIIFNPDEEIGSLGSAPYLKEAAQGKDFGLIFEPAMDEHGCVVDKRKGSGKIAVAVTGIAAHAGRDFHKGVNAITALSDFLLTMDKLNGQREGFTLNVGKVVGGIAENVVPEHAVARLDIRYEETGARDWLMNYLNEAVADWKKRHKATIQIEPVFTRDPKNMDKKYQQLLDQVILTGKSLNQTIHTKSSGGVCDGNILASAGLVNVDTLGVLGGGLHSEQEFMLTDSLVSRAQLTALLIMRYAAGEWSFDHA
jgi:glutamate carboxypeptidase